MKASYLEVLREVYFYGIIAKVSSEGTPLRNAAEHCEQQGALEIWICTT